MANLGPGGQEVGRVSIRVLPDSSKFGADLKVQLEKIEKALKVSIPTELDTSGVLADIESLKTELNAAATEVKIPVTADAKSVAATIESIKAEAKAVGGVEIPVKADAKATDTLLASLSRNAAARGGAAIPFHASKSAVVSALADIAAKVKSVGGVEVPAKVEVATISLSDGFTSRLRAQVQAAAKAAEADIPLTVSGENLRRKLAEAVKVAEARLNAQIPLDVEQARNFRLHAAAAVAEVEAIAKAAHASVKVDVDVDKGGTLRRRIAAVRSDISNLFDGVGNLVGAFNKFSPIDEILASAAQTSVRILGIVAAIAPLVLIIGAGIAAVAPALALTLPILGAMIAAVGAVALGFSEFKNKLQASPAFAALGKQIGVLRTQVGDLLAQGLDPLLAKLATAQFPGFANGMRQIAGVLNGVIRQFLTFASSAEVVSQTDAIWRGLAQAIATVGSAVTPLARAFLQITTASLPGFKLLTQALAGSAIHFSSLIDSASKSGRLTQVITQATKDLIGFSSAVFKISGDLLHLLGSLEPAARAVFSTIGQILDSLITGLDQAVSNIAQPDSIFRPFLIGIGKVVTTIRGIPKAVLDAFAPLAHAPAFDRLITNIGHSVIGLADLLKSVTDIAAGLVKAFNQAFGPTIISLVADFFGLLARSAHFLAEHQTLIILLATAYSVRYVRALQLAVLWNARFAAVVAGAALKEALSATVGLVSQFAAGVTEVATATRSLGVASGASAAIGGIGIAAKGAVGGLKALGAAVLTDETILTGGILAALALAAIAINHFRTESEKGKDAISAITSGFDPTNIDAADKKVRDLAGASLAAHAAADKAAKSTHFWNAAWRLFTGNDKLTKLAAESDAADAAFHKLVGQMAVVHETLLTVSQATHTSVNALKGLAEAKHIDLSKSTGAAELSRALAELDTQTGLTNKDLVHLATTSGKAFQQVQKEIKAAVDATNQAFNTDTDVLGNFASNQAKASKAVESAAKRLTTAKQHLSDTEARVGAQQKVTIAGTQAIARAQERVAQADDAVAKARATQAAASLTQQYKTTIDGAKKFVRDVTAATLRGLNPNVVSQLLEDGPKKATPVLEAILSDHSGRMIKLVNDSEAQLSKINLAVLLQQRVIQRVINDTSKQTALDANAAMQIIAAEFASGGKASAAALAKSLKIPPSEIKRIADEFGIPLAEDIQRALDANKPKITITVHPLIVQPGAGNLAKGAAYGGLITGAGTSRSDSIPMMLSHKEFVTQAPAVRYYGADVMHALNRMSIPPDLLRGLLGKQPGVSVKLAGRATVASVPTIRERVMAAPVAAAPPPRLAGIQDGLAFPGGTLVLVDQDGQVLGRMRAAAIRTHRDRYHAQRMARLGGTWGAGG